MDHLGDMHEARAQLSENLGDFGHFVGGEVASGLLFDNAEEVDGELRAGEVNHDPT